MPMLKFRTQRELIGAVALMEECFAMAAAIRRVDAREAVRVFELLPEPLLNAPCFLDKLTGKWRYEFGQPIDGLAGGQVVTGTNIAPLVQVLFDVLRAAVERLTPKQLSVYVNRLTDTGRHQEYLTEFAPIIRLPSTVNAVYEVPGLGADEQVIDWLITASGVHVALEVKYRQLDLIEHVQRVQAGDTELGGAAPAPTHDHARILRSIETKFPSVQPAERLQGAWIRTEIQQEEQELGGAFASLDAQRVHFVVLGDFKDDVSIVARSREIADAVLTALHIRESRRFLLRRDQAAQPAAVAG